jgi:putative membrane protein
MPIHKLRTLSPKLAIRKQIFHFLIPLTIYLAAIAFAKIRLGVKPVDWGIGATATLGALLAFLVSFRANAAYNRWWEARQLWGRLVNESRNLALKARVHTTAPADDLQALATWIAGFAVALREHLRAGIELNQVPGFESAAERPKHVPQHVALCIHRMLARWFQEGHTHGDALRMLDLHAKALMDVCGACERIRNTPLSASYRALVRHAIAVYLLATPVTIVLGYGWIAIPGHIVVSYFLLGVEITAEHIEQPFGCDADDLPLDALCEVIRSSTAEALGVEQAPLSPKLQ